MCPCGQPALARGLCRPCYDRHRLETLRFAGHRQSVLARDRHRCAACDAAGPLIVHHRTPGENRPDALITLCIPCHVRTHKSSRLPAPVPDLLLTLWAEQHPGQPLQLQLDLA